MRGKSGIEESRPKKRIRARYSLSGTNISFGAARFAAKLLRDNTFNKSILTIQKAASSEWSTSSSANPVPSKYSNLATVAAIFSRRWTGMIV
jgi:hypothetical protein